MNKSHDDVIRRHRLLALRLELGVLGIHLSDLPSMVIRGPEVGHERLGVNVRILLRTAQKLLLLLLRLLRLLNALILVLGDVLVLLEHGGEGGCAMGVV
jgi:hypothetical protein